MMKKQKLLLLNPARNNVHDVAFSFVDSLVKEGKEAIKLCFSLISKDISVGGLS